MAEVPRRGHDAFSRRKSARDGGCPALCSYKACTVASLPL